MSSHDELNTAESFCDDDDKTKRASQFVERLRPCTVVRPKNRS